MPGEAGCRIPGCRTPKAGPPKAGSLKAGDAAVDDGTGDTADTEREATSMRRWVVPAAAAVLLIAGGCGSAGTGTAAPPPARTGAPPTSVAPTTDPPGRTPDSLAAFGRRYLRIITPANEAIGEFNRRLSALHDPTAAQVRAIDGPVIAALLTARTSLLAERWPAAASSEVHQLAEATSSVVGDLRSLGDADATNGERLLDELRDDAAHTAQVASSVRADLHLTSNL